jgi:hypothetical protein
MAQGGHRVEMAAGSGAEQAEVGQGSVLRGLENLNLLCGTLSLLLWLMKLVLIGYLGTKESRRGTFPGWPQPLRLPTVSSRLGGGEGFSAPHPIQSMVIASAGRAVQSQSTGRFSSTPEKTGGAEPGGQVDPLDRPAIGIPSPQRGVDSLI